MTLMQLWRLHRAECRAIGSIVADARGGTLPGVEPLSSGFGFSVTDQRAALAAMRHGPSHFEHAAVALQARGR
ncbi:hypothetical protein CIT31_02600 [Mesorhizobium wenxiniae]|uniref:Uncharacterized protein n=1 Tax=Mesorhizobium wenxiniae TaxID=2014805 RepID=A0A271KLE0_9HYPH|nr:hypothetical protein CIT31_02600 [Mesorhizobium wenxiniae]